MTNEQLLEKHGAERARVIQQHYSLKEILRASFSAIRDGDLRDDAHLTDLYDLRNGLPWNWRRAEAG